MEGFNHEQHMVAAAFQKGMAGYSHEPIALYGIGQNTKAVLSLTSDFSFVGLLDANTVGEEYYGKRVLSLEEAAALSKRIVIVARSVVTPIIFQRIKDFARNNSIIVHDYSGRILGDEQERLYDPDLDYWKHSLPDMRREIDAHDVISFDIFDTLIGRYILEPADLFAVMERDIRQTQRLDIPFKELRMRAQRECGYGASLSDIYMRICMAGVSEELCKSWREQEIQWEMQLAYPRKRMVETFYYALEKGKQVYLLSDMYLPKSVICRMLEKNGIIGFDELLLSCEEKAEKSDGRLFAKLRSKAAGKSILHIGDNRFHDIDMAKRADIGTWQVWSAFDMFMASSLGPLLSKPLSALGDRLIMGIFCAKLFEDPFALHATKGKVSIGSLEQLAYCFIGPLALGFMQWAEERVEALGIEQFIFPARDGLLFYRMGKLMQQRGYMQNVEQRYFKASRRALSMACIYSEADIGPVLDRRHSGTNESLLQDRFGVIADARDLKNKEPAGTLEGNWIYISQYSGQIIERARWERENYRGYLKAKGLFNNKKTAIFDFVAKGSVQYCLERQLGKKLVGLYYATVEHPNEMYPEGGDIFTAFGNVIRYGNENIFSRIYMAIEALLIDGDGMLEYIDADGNPVFRCKEGISYTQALKLQDYCLEFASWYFELYGNEKISVKKTEELIDALFGGCCQVNRQIAEVFSHDDSDDVSKGMPLYSIYFQAVEDNV